LRFSGNEAAVRSRSQAIDGEELDADIGFWSQIKEMQHSFFTGDNPLWRLSVKPAAEQSDEHCLLDWGGAQRWFRGGTELAAREAQAEGMGGQATLFRGGDREAEVFHSRTDGQKRVHLALKQAFDPHGIFNPGRMYGWL
jgi:glycolate oxidase FAD binding subunit